MASPLSDMLRDRRALDVLAADEIIFFTLFFSRATAEKVTGVTKFTVSREADRAEALRFEGVRGDLLSGSIASSCVICCERLVGVAVVDAAADDAVPILFLPLLRGVVDMVMSKSCCPDRVVRLGVAVFRGVG